MSRVPPADGARWGYRMGDQPAVDGMYRDGFLCPLSEMVMGETAERLAEMYKLTREEQDAFALRSQQRAAKAAAAGRFDDEIVPVKVPAKGGEHEVRRDEHVRPDATLVALGRLPPVFKEEGGTVTAGNSSGITDGAAAHRRAGRGAAASLGVTPWPAWSAWLGGRGPARHGIRRGPATRRVLERTSLRAEDLTSSS
jgi:acetyl-CoA C-acetyltransferase